MDSEGARSVVKTKRLGGPNSVLIVTSSRANARKISRWISEAPGGDGQVSISLFIPPTTELRFDGPAVANMQNTFKASKKKLKRSTLEVIVLGGLLNGFPLRQRTGRARAVIGGAL